MKSSRAGMARCRGTRRESNCLIAQMDGADAWSIRRVSRQGQPRMWVTRNAVIPLGSFRVLSRIPGDESDMRQRLLLPRLLTVAARSLVATFVAAAAQNGVPSADATGRTKPLAWEVVSVRPVAPNSCTGDAGMRGTTDCIS